MSQHIGPYQIIAELGAGGMGLVYRALDTMLGREVAIKRLRADFAANPGVLERFRREAQMQARLNHPNIAQLYTLVQDGNSWCLVMEFVDGTILSRFMPLSWEAALPIALQVLEGLEYAHRRGVLHRDIKPENIMIDHEGMAKIMDFGIAHAIGSSRMTREKSIIGTLEYVSPERILGEEIDGRSDLYSVGVMLFEMISGRLPFDFNNEYELMRCHIERQPYRVSNFVAGVPEFLDDAIQIAIRKKPADRFAGCAAMAAELRQKAGERGVALLSIASTLRLGDRPASDSPSKEIAAWITRIRALIERKQFDTAERLIDTALNDFPSSLELAQMRSMLPQSSSSTQRFRTSDKFVVEEKQITETRRTLSRLLAMEKSGEFERALVDVEKELQTENGVPALRVARAYYLRLTTTKG